MFQTIRTGELRGSSLLNRIVRAISLDRTLYEEVGKDKHAMRQAVILVIAVAIATGVGTLDNGGIRDFGPASTLVMISWFVWSGLVLLISRKFGGFAPRATGRGKSARVEWNNIARVLAFAQAPGLLRIFGVVSGLGFNATITGEQLDPASS